MRDTQRGRDTGRERNRLPARSPMWDRSPDPIPGSRSEPKADAQLLSHPGIPYQISFKMELYFPQNPVLNKLGQKLNNVYQN